MKIKNLFFAMSALTACAFLNSCICRIAWNDCVPEKSIDYYVKTADLVEGQYVYSNASGYYVLLERRRLQNGRYEAYAFPVMFSHRREQGSYTTCEMVQIPASFAHYLMGENGSSSPAWMNPRPEYNASRLNRYGKVVRLPEMSVTREYALSSDVGSGETANNAVTYALYGWVFDVTASAIGTAFCTAAAPFVLLTHPAGLFVRDSHPDNQPDGHLVYSYAAVGGDSPTDTTAEPKPKSAIPTSSKSAPKEKKSQTSSSAPVLLEAPSKTGISPVTSGR